MTFRNRVQARSADQREARRRIKNGTHELVLLAQGDRTAKEVGSIAARVVSWWQDLRRGKIPVYGALLRFIDVGIALGTPREVLLRIPEWLAWYINDRCDERASARPRSRSAKVASRTTGTFRPAA